MSSPFSKGISSTTELKEQHLPIEISIRMYLHYLVGTDIRSEKTYILLYKDYKKFRFSLSLRAS